MNQPSQPKNRPIGIVGIAVLWILIGIITIIVNLNIILGDLGLLSNLSNPYLHEWVRFGLPAELMINFFSLALGFLTLLVVYGLWTARSWSYDFGLALPTFMLILSVAGTMLYASAPPELGFQPAVNAGLFAIPWGLAFLVFTWGYLTRPHVKQYLNRIPTPPPTQMAVPPTPSTLPVPPPPETVAMSEGKKFCRYCGVENKTDAVFCEKCGRKIA